MIIEVVMLQWVVRLHGIAGMDFIWHILDWIANHDTVCNGGYQLYVLYIFCCHWYRLSGLFGGAYSFIHSDHE